MVRRGEQAICQNGRDVLGARRLLGSLDVVVQGTGFVQLIMVIQHIRALLRQPSILVNHYWPGFILLVYQMQVV